MGFTITTQPADTTIIDKTVATFTISTSGLPLLGGLPLDYQWYSYNYWDGTSNLIAGATSNPYTFTVDSDTDTGKDYFCIINEKYRTRYAKLTIKSQIPKIHPTLSTTTNLIEGSSIPSSGDYRPFRFSHTIPLSGSYNLRWTKAGIDKSTSENYRFFPNYKIDNGAMVKCILSFVDGAGTLTRSTQTTIAVTPADPIITEQPKDQTLFSGNDIRLKAQGIETNETITYQWYKNSGTPTLIAGASGETYYTVATSGDNGMDYWCEVSGVSVSTNTETATITIIDDKYNINLERVNSNFVGISSDTGNFILSLGPDNLYENTNDIWKAHKFNLTGSLDAVSKLSQYVNLNGITSLRELIDEVKPIHTRLNEQGGIIMEFTLEEGDGSTTSTVTSAGIGEDFVVYDSSEIVACSGEVYLTINGEYRYGESSYIPTEQSNWNIEDVPPNSRTTFVFGSSAIPTYVQKFNLTD